MESLDQTTIIDLSACEKEQIHLIDSVQPHGALLVLSEPELKVLQVSPNAISLLNCAHKDLVGQRAEVLFSEESVLLIKKILNTHASDDFWPVVPCSISVLQSRIHLQGLLHRYQGVCILELEPMSDPNTEELIAFRHWISTDFAQLFAANTMQKLLERCATEIQKMTGFDRVLIYQFDQDWHGSVVAENKQDFMQSYIGHKFPASDIPPQARELYTKNLIRVLASVDAVQSPITPQINPLTGNRLDLTYSVLRSMSPVHIEYLKNMGVSASMSISLMAKDKLWGLIVCHNKTVKTLDFVKRSTCELIGRLLSGLIEQIEKHEITKGQLRLGLEVEKIIFKLSRSEDLFGSLRQQLSDIIIVPNADGIALISDGTIESCGTTPDEQAIKTLTSWLEEVVQESFFCSEKLSLEHPQWSQIAITASGLIAINISSTSPRWILWFRKEQIKKISWAGNPQKPVEIESKLAPIHPRKSFEIWSESVSGHSLPWKSFEREAAGLLQKHIFGLSLAEIVRTGKTNKILRQQREDMIAILTHDLSVPAIALERVLDSLVSDKTGKIQRELQDIFRVMEVANHKQKASINKLLQVLVLEAGSSEIKSGEIDCAELIDASIAEVALLPATQAQIVTRVKQKGQIFRSDRESLRRVVVNLLDNAVRAIDRNGTIQIHCECSAAGLHLEVADNGSGISLEDQPNLFDRFWQGGQSRSYTSHVGMGLYLCKKIIDSLKGEISFKSSPGKGSTFKVFVPNMQ